MERHWLRHSPVTWMVPHGHPRRWTYNAIVEADYNPTYRLEANWLRNKPYATRWLKQRSGNAPSTLAADGSFHDSAVRRPTLEVMFVNGRVVSVPSAASSDIK